MAICRLCHQERDLCLSHIIPEFLFREIYDDNRRMMGITGSGPRGWNYLQRGMVERLLCDRCEQLINDNYERPYLRTWIRNCPVPNPWDRRDHMTIKLDYVITKLFHLSILFRASVSSLTTFSLVDLGPHEDQIRQMLLNNSAGTLEEYPFYGYAVVHGPDNRLVDVITPPFGGRYEGQRHYQMMYGGLMWVVSVSSHQVDSFNRVSVQPDGTSIFIAVSWNEVGALQDARDALLRARCP